MVEEGLQAGQLIVHLAVGAGMGFLISALSVLSDVNNAWNNRQFAYTAILGAFAALGIINGVEGGITAENFIGVILMIAGATFLANKGIKLASKAGLKKK